MENFRLVYPAERHGIVTSQRMLDTTVTSEYWKGTEVTKRSIELPFGLRIPLPSSRDSAPMSRDLIAATRRLHELGAREGVTVIDLASSPAVGATPGSALEQAVQSVRELADANRAKYATPFSLFEALGGNLGH